MLERIQRQLEAEIARVNARVRGETPVRDERREMERAFAEGDELAMRFATGPATPRSEVERRRS